jgi:asparagine synthase (glutamine-hydrolysing)
LPASQVGDETFDIMCGIWASLGFAPPSAAIDAVAHRGPDGRGWKEFSSTAGTLVLAHRRLAIIDTSDAGLQPMARRDGRYWITYNGEVYNYVELRAELEAKGHRFATRSDTEVMLAAYEEWGEGCLGRFAGMFAFVIYDRQAQRLFAARDRFGVKPLYRWQSNGRLAFASEIKQFAAVPGFSARANPQRCYDFLAGGLFDHTGETLFAGVEQLRGGECVTIDVAHWRRDQQVEPRRWYRLPAPGGLELDAATAAERFRALLAEAVRIHLRADVTVGSCLSGGLDSSSIVCLAVDELARQRASNVFHTVSSCFDEKSVDERPFIEAVVHRAGVLNSQVFPRPEGLAEAVETVTRHQDEPFGSTSIFAQWCVFQRAGAEGIKVMLDGQGADEQLAGYHGLFPLYYRQLLRQGRFDRLLRTLRDRRRLHGTTARAEVMALAMMLIPAMILRRVAVWARRARGEAWLGPALLAVSGDAPAPHHAAIARDRLGPIRSLGQNCRAQVQTTNLPMLLHYEDRSSMAHGVEARVPFLDHRLVEFSIALGDAHKMDGAETKAVLRNGLKDILPPAVRERHDKLGFATPEEIWLKGPLRGFIMDGIEETLRRFPDFFDAQGLRQMSREVLDGVRPFDFKLWRAVNFGTWGRVFAVSA